MGKYDKYKGRYKTKYSERKDYFDKYERKITPERKAYLKDYNKKITTEWYRKYRSTENYKLATRIQNLIRRVLSYKSEIKTTKSTILVGWNKKEFINRLGCLENKHIDHKIPVTWFGKDTPMFIINDLDNLHLLGPTENLQKSNTFSHPVCKEYFNKTILFIKDEYRGKVSFLQ